MRYSNTKKQTPRIMLLIPNEELCGMTESILRDDFILVNNGEYDLSVTEENKAFVICRTGGSLCSIINRPISPEALKQAIIEATEDTVEIRFTADPTTLSATLGDKSVRLTETEFRLYSAILENSGNYVSAEKLSTAVWGKYDRNLCTVYVSYLRRKLDSAFGDGTLITARGKGYRLRDTH